MKLTNGARPKMAFAVLLTLALVLAGTSAAAALPGVSMPRVPPKMPWLGWLPGGQVIDLPTQPNTPAVPGLPGATAPSR